MTAGRGGALARAGATGILAAGMLVAAAPVAPAAAAPRTDVVQGEVLRLVSVADWAAASSLLPGQPIRWDVTVSADAPDPGTVRVGISATGDADLVVDAALCTRPWTEAGCPAEASVLKDGWDLPRDGSEVPLVEMADTDVAHLRLTIALDGADLGSTDVRIHAQGAGESAAVGPDGGLATTGLPPSVPWAAGGAMALLAAGGALAATRRRRSVVEDEP
ncbi:hypothetical protein [Microbacterium sp. H83]|uniref:hypothetical protein n=1 Tax=Microbacterium sp. H83 TaxID=1827324 RepID=UPI0007F51EBF|nr:hypothetical protein [Microbacterium sp. H83]OAN36593.1 hypothetical protein A4X16_04090 [Microbacterium sp. H83]